MTKVYIDIMLGRSNLSELSMIEDIKSMPKETYEMIYTANKQL